MPTWKIAAVQMDCRLGAVEANLAAVRSRLAEAADAGARLVVFPECALTGYGFASRAEALKVAQTIPGPGTDGVAADCARRNVWAAFGLLERDGDRLVQRLRAGRPDRALCHLPQGSPAVSRRWTGSPTRATGRSPSTTSAGCGWESGSASTAVSRRRRGCWPCKGRTSWCCRPTGPTQAIKQATLVTRVRAFENHIYYAAVNRVGNEAGFHYVGHSSVSDCNGDFLAFADHDREAILYAEIDPEAARKKKVVHCAGEYEIDRLNWRRPELYAPLVEPQAEPFVGHRR